ncbi:amino acid adenylation domain-containing protein [Bacillus thuringiensis]|uniref:amino acid adenylation domain-containing protein n=1 Tax=Bacillus thuringiensis TaxID=1428 RepID=UPI003BF9D333
MVDRSLEMIIGILGILKAGGAYLPVDPEYPNDRISYMLDDSRASILLVKNQLAKDVMYSGKVINLKNHSLYEQEKSNLLNSNQPNQLAYVIYTSGTTGAPKGVMVKHKGVVNYIYWAKKSYVNDGKFDFPLYSSIAFDLTVTSLYTPLVTGNKIVVYEGTDKALLIRRIIEENKIDIIKLTPTHLRLLENMDLSKSKIKKLIVGGEELKVEQAEKIYRAFNENIDIYNEYGPTEATVGCMIYKYNVEKDKGISVSIGVPADNTKLYVLGKNMELLPIGVAGELCVSGDGLASGYINREELTAAKFLDNPFEPNSKIYKTGDVVKWVPDGNMEYLGRMDNQVKIRGYRIEIGEIENQLLKIKDVKEAVVMAKKDQNKNMFLCSYITSNKKVEASKIKEKLTRELPMYMVPSYIIQIDKMPLSSNGKIDTKALPVIDVAELIESKYEEPRDKIEEILVKVWEKVLGIDPIGINYNYYEIGGDSIKSILIVSELRKYHLRLEVKDLMQFPRIKELREHIKLDDIQVDQSAIEGKAELVPIQKWFIEQEFSQKNHYNQAFMFYKQDGINEKILRKSFLEIVKHHDALRMMYIKENDEFKQWNRGIEQAEDAFSLELYDVRGDENPERSIEMLSNEIQKGMSLEDGILIKLGLFKTKTGDHLLVAIHHMVIDGLSWRILLEDLETLYLKIENEEEVKLPQKTTAFKEWTQKLNEFAKGKEIQKELDYWKALESIPFETLPKDFSECESLYEESQEISINFTKEQTEKLLRKTNAAYNTHINDILLCSLGLAVNKWCGMDKVCVSLEGHGREDILKDVSINRTIGWFTSVYPVTLDMSYSDNLSYSIKLTKETLRHIPNKGIGYGILKYLSNVEKGIYFKSKPEISFNYLGEFGQEESDGLFRYSNIPTGISISRENKKSHSIEINGLVIEGQLRFIFSYNTKEYKWETIEELTNVYKTSLSEVIEHCENKKVAEKTPWDYGDPDLDLVNLKKITACGKAIEKIHSLSPMQEGMLYNSIIEKDSSAYLEQSELTIEGIVDVEILNSILNKIIEKYEILRTVFFYEDISVFKQAVLRKRKIKIHYEDISHWDIETKENYIEQFKIRDRNTRFQLTKDSLIRVSVIKVQNNIFKIIYSFHHIIMDGWSIGIILKEIMDNYKAFVKGKEIPIEKTVSYSRYLQWLDQQDKVVALEYWKNYLHAYEQEIVFPEHRLKVDKYKRRQERISLTETITAKLKNLAETNSITLSSIIQTAWGVLLQKYNNTNDVVFGSVVSGRPSEINGIENMVGLFINAVPIRLRIKDTTSFIELAKKINKDFIEANTYSYCSLAEVQALTNMKNKLINHVVVYENYPLDMNLASFHSNYESELKITATSGFEQTNYNLELLIIPGNELNMKITYNNNIYSKEVISAILQNLVNVLNHLAFNQEVKVSDIDMVSGVERNKLLREFNDTEVIYSKEKTIQELFEEQVERTPTAIALEFNGESLTYNELNKKANKLARILRRNDVKENTVVPILVRRSFNLIIGILGILKAGGCYLPLDPEYPVDRIDYMLEDSKGSLLLTEENLSNHLSFTGSIISIDSQELEYQMDSNVDKINKAEDLAYVIYTSGSTGKPKGVAIEHRAFHNFIKGITERIDFTYNNVILAVTTCSFDIFGLETILPLIKGGKVVIANETEQKDPYLLNKVIVDSEVNTIQLTPSRLKLMLNSSNSKECFEKLNLIMVGGEAFPHDLLYQLKECTNSKIYNMYGPTETTIWSTIKDLTKENSINIGKPIANTQVYIIDDVGNTVPMGSVGELCIAGDGLARGYLNKEELTVKKFVENSFVNVGKMYKTGDLARWLPNEELDIIGRIDNQVKIRGYRIELGEIENVANQYGKIKECIAVGKTNSFEVQELVLYYVAKEKINTSELIKYLSSMLPTYMIPQIYMEIDEIPLTTNGKLNRKALPEPTRNRPELNSNYEEVVTDIQRDIRNIWIGILNIKKVGIHDNFFEAGGNSIKIVAMHNEIKKLYPKKIQITDIFAHPTIYRLAQFIESIEKFEEISTSVAKDITPIELPLEYFWLEDCLNEEPLLKFKLTEDEYSGLLGICGDNYEIYHLLLACYVFLLADTCGKNLVTIQLDNQGEEQISQISVDVSGVENFYDIIRTIKDKIGNVAKSQQYSIDSPSELFDSVIDHCIFPLFRVSNNSNVNYLRTYDLVFEIHEGHSEVEIICIYNDQKLNQSKIKDLFYNYIKLIQVITQSTVSGSI